MPTLLITGASTGIGAATARQAVEGGWNVVLSARSEDKLRALSDELGSVVDRYEGDRDTARHPPESRRVLCLVAIVPEADEPAPRPRKKPRGSETWDF